ncbi:MAG: type II secretion system F family protein [Oscillospiraceae bacterium]
MATFKYKAVSKSGAAVSGFVDAYDEFEAVEKIKQECSIVTKIVPVLSNRSVDINVFASHRINEKSLAMACSQFGIILKSGLPIVRAVQLIASQMDDKAFKKILEQVAEDVAGGHSLAQSFENKAGNRLPTTFIETIRAGEEAGTLDVAFQKLHTYYDKSSKIKAKVISAMAYPVFLMIMAVAVIAVIMIVAVPLFTSMFEGMGTELPLPTRVLIGVSNFFTNFGLYLLFALIALVFGLKFWGRTENGRLSLARFKLNIPILGRVNIMKGASQFANTMSTMLTAGLPMVRAVAITGKVLDNYLLGTQIGAAVSGIEEGRRLGECMRKSEYFPELLIEMTAVGEETGSMESTLDVIGAYFDSEVEITSARALSMIEPVVVCVLAVVVVFILLAVYLPMFGIYASI